MYKYKLMNNHYVVNIDNKNYLIDTGSPFSFYIHTPHNVVIDGRVFPLTRRFPNQSIEPTIELVGLDIDGFIGMDIISQTSLTIYKNGNILFGVDNINGIKVPIYMSLLPVIEYSDFNNLKGLMIIDTGAKYGYGDKHLFYGLNPFNHVNDYNPILGHLSSDIYNADIKIGNKPIRIEVCDNSEVMSQLSSQGISLIVNITNLFNEACVFDMRNRILILD